MATTERDFLHYDCVELESKLARIRARLDELRPEVTLTEDVETVREFNRLEQRRLHIEKAMQQKKCFLAR